MSELYYWQDWDKLLGGRLIQFACELMQAEGLELPGNTIPDKQKLLYNKYSEHVQSFINQYGKELITAAKIKED